jgi:hypothetical protein
MSALYDWLAGIDPAVAFLFLLPFAIALLGLLADATGSRRPSAGEERTKAGAAGRRRSAPRLTAHQR